MEKAVEEVKKAFAAYGFGLPAGTIDLDFKKIFQAKKVDNDFPQLHTLGFCKPNVAHQVLKIEPAAAVLLPCTVAISEIESGVYEVASLSPLAMLDMFQHKDKLKDIIHGVDKDLLGALDSLPIV